MPSKYSHGVVLASYSSRGVISLPNDKQLDHLKSRGAPLPYNATQQSTSTIRGRAPSAPPSHNHRSIVGSTSTRTSKSSKKRSSIISVQNTSSQEFRSGTATSHYRTLGDPQTASSASRSRRVIIDSEEEDVDDDDEKPQDPRPGVPIHSEASSPFESTLGDSGPVQDPIPNQKVEYLSQSQAATRRAEPKHVSLLAAQKCARKADLQNRARQASQPNQSASLSSKPPPRDPNDPLLSVHEFLGPSPIFAARAHSNKPKPVTSKESSDFATASGAPPLRLTKIPSTIPESPPHHASERDHNSIGLSNGQDHQYDQNKTDDEYSAAGSASQTQGHDQKLLERTEERESELIDTPAITHIQVDLSQIPFEEPDFEVSENRDDQPPLPVKNLQQSSNSRPTIMGSVPPGPANDHNESNPPQKGITVEPDFSHFSDDEERGDPMNSALTNASTRNRYYRAFGKNVVRNDPNSDISQSKSPQLTRGNTGRRLWSLSSARSSDTRNRQQGATNTSSTENEANSTPDTHPTARKLKTDKQPFSKLKSEEEVRAQNPTPIPSPASSAVSATPLRTRKALPSSPMLIPTPPQPTTHISNIGMPSIVRSPQRQKHVDRAKTTTRTYSLGRSSTPHGQAIVYANPRDTMSPTRSFRRDDGINRPSVFHLDHSMESEEDDADESWTLPTTPVSQPPVSFKSTPLTRLQADFVTQSRPGSTTPRPERRPQQQTRRRSQTLSNHRATPVERSLLSAFDDTSSISSSYLNHHGEPEPHFNAANQGAYRPTEHEPESDPDAALPPPDISRYPSDRTSPRSQKNEQHRLSSLTTLSRRSKTKRRSTVHYDDRIDSIVQNLNVPEGSDSEADKRAADNADIKSGPGETTRVERLEALMRKAEEEAKANRGMRGVWGRLKRRIER